MHTYLALKCATERLYEDMMTWTQLWAVSGNYPRHIAIMPWQLRRLKEHKNDNLTRRYILKQRLTRNSSRRYLTNCGTTLFQTVSGLAALPLVTMATTLLPIWYAQRMAEMNRLVLMVPPTACIDWKFAGEPLKCDRKTWCPFNETPISFL